MVSNIWMTIADGNTQGAKQLIESGEFEANSKDQNGYTPVHAACAYGNLELLEYLVSKGGDVNVADSDGDTSLFHCEDVKTVDALISKYGADWKVTNGDGMNLREYFVDDGEYPEIIAYFDKLFNETGSMLEGAPANIRYGMTEDLPVDEDRQRKIMEIVNGENPEENLQKFLRESIQQQMVQQEQSPDSKRRHH